MLSWMTQHKLLKTPLTYELVVWENSETEPGEQLGAPSTGATPTSFTP